MQNNKRNILVWVLIFILSIGFYDLFLSSSFDKKQNEFPFSEFLDKVDNDNVRDITMRGGNITGHLKDGSSFKTYGPQYPELIDKLKNKNVRFEIEPIEGKMGNFWAIIISWMPLIIIIGVWFYFMRQMQSGGGKAMSFSKSKAKLLTEKTSKVTFSDVAGITEAKEELVEIVEFLRDPTKFQNIGGTIPKGCLLIGSPGTGKTLLARAIAGEAKVPFFSISGSDFVEMFVGVGASRVRDMFEQGKKNAPCIIFIDEIDAVGRNRGIGLGGGNDEREQTLNQMLVEMDGFESNEGVIIIAATNRPDVLDPALLRPGRFDRQIVVPLPDVVGREEILNVHLKKVKSAPDVKANIIARGTPGFSGAELKNVINEAALLAAKKNMKVVTMHELEEAKDKVMMGSERRSMKIDDEEKKLTAYHEGGHALVAHYQPASDPIHKATIIPRGQALGMVMQLPKGDQFSITREKLVARMAIAMGGRVAEEIIFGYDKVTTGASSDIKQATKIARGMVTEWGMSDKVGPIDYAGKKNDMYGGGESVSAQSAMTANMLDDEVKKLVEAAHETAKNIITTHLDKLHNLANALIEHETLTGDDIADVFADKEIKKKSASRKKTKNISKDESENI
jgi:cell division protease FtsH